MYYPRYYYILVYRCVAHPTNTFLKLLYVNFIKPWRIVVLDWNRIHRAIVLYIDYLSISLFGKQVHT